MSNRWERRHKPKRRYYYGLVFFFTIIVLYAFFNITDVRVWPFNPPDSQNTIHLSLEYPSPSGLLVNALTYDYPVHVDIWLKSTGPIIEGQPVTLSASGGITHAFSKENPSILVGFAEAEDYIPTVGTVYSVGPNYGGISLDKNSTHPDPTRVTGIGKSVFTTTLGLNTVRIYWPVEGSYYPSVVIDFPNETEIQQTYPMFHVTVASEDVAFQERVARINIALTVALVGFGIMEGLKIIQETGRPFRSQDESSGSGTETSDSTPKSMTPKPTKERAKDRVATIGSELNSKMPDKPTKTINTPASIRDSQSASL